MGTIYVNALCDMERQPACFSGLDGYCIFDVEVAGSSSRARLAGVKAKDYTVAEWPAASPDEPSAHGPDFNGAGVKWGTWTNGDTSADAKSKTGVIWYSLNKVPWHRPFKWRLTVNINDTYDYNFKDESSDTYSLSCCQTGMHYVDFNSDAPAIVATSDN